MYVCRQWDNASPHTEKKTRRLIDGLSGPSRWEWTLQPANTPLSNTKDAAMFLALAKEVLAIGGLENSGRQLTGGKLWEALQKAWRSYPADKIARAYVHHTQVAAAIYACEGSNDFVREHKGLCFGVRRECRPYYDDELAGEEGGLDLSSLVSRNLMDAQGVSSRSLSTASTRRQRRSSVTPSRT